MQFSLDQRTASLGVGEFASFSTCTYEGPSGPSGPERAQLGQHWHSEWRARTAAVDPSARFEISVNGTLRHGGWALQLSGRIDQQSGDTLREIKTVTRALPADEADLRAGFPAYFLQLATYAVLLRADGTPPARLELVFIEALGGISQTVALTAFDEALVLHQAALVVEFLESRRLAAQRRRALSLAAPFASLRPGQEGVITQLSNTLAADAPSGRSVFFEAPTGFGKTGCTLAAALTALRDGTADRLIWLSGKATGQLQAVETLHRLLPAHPGLAWQMRNKSEHCINSVFHCMRDACAFLDGAQERWPNAGLARFWLDPHHPRDLLALHAAGQDARICPYEITRAALPYHDIWIGDYNYLFAPESRQIFLEQPGFDPARTLLIIDEAHNLPERVAAAWSQSANYTATAALLAELDHLAAPTPLLLALEQWARLLGHLDPCDVLEPPDEADFAAALERVATALAKHGVTPSELGPTHTETLWALPRLHALRSQTQLRHLWWAPRAGTLEATCTDASALIGETLAAYRSSLLLSATLAPFDQLAAACALPPPTADSPPSTGHRQPPTAPRPLVLQAPAPWREHAYDVAIDVRVDTTFRRRSESYGLTAETIVQLHAAAHRAVAVFFPSYAYAEAVLRATEHLPVPPRIALQPRGADLATQTAWIEESLTLADALFLVLGSSFAEGIDTLGGRLTHAMVVGPALPEVNALQRARQTAHAGVDRDTAFRRTYLVPGLRKVNQALGRLVRAPGQHAKVLLHCRRFADSSYASLLAREYQFGREIAHETDLVSWLATPLGAAAP